VPKPETVRNRACIYLFIT